MIYAHGSGNYAVRTTELDIARLGLSPGKGDSPFVRHLAGVNTITSRARRLLICLLMETTAENSNPRTLSYRKGVNAMARYRPARKRCLAIAILALAALIAHRPPPVAAQTLSTLGETPGGERPLELVKASFARVLGAAGEQRQVELRRVTEELFDFHEMSRRVLGAHWQEGSGPEQEEFVRLFIDMLERMYVTSIASLPLAAVKFEGESIAGVYARVSTRIVGRRGDTSVEYRLVDHTGRWVVYDIAVEGVSMVSSYRSQFNSLLRNSTFSELLGRLRSREVGAKAEQGP
jgi:phospholipid transport system substrate-binding protein